MICAHASTKAKHTGQRDICLSCRIDIIWNGKWVWYYGLDEHKRAKLERAFTADRITGAHE